MKRQVVIAAILCALCFSGHVAMADSIEGWGSSSNGLDQFPAGADFVAVAAGYAHSLALRSDGTVEAWGSNTFGQTDVPADCNNIVAIAAGEHFSLALKKNEDGSLGSLVAWGIEDGSTPDDGQVSDLPEGNDFVAIAAGRYHGLALKNDGSIVGWGRQTEGQTTTAIPNDFFVKLAGGGFHSLGIRADGLTGTIRTWGTSFWGLDQIPADANFIAVSAGQAHSMALREDNKIAAWGVDNGGTDDFKQVTDTPQDSGYVAIAAGYYFSVALKADGSLAAWGKNSDNQTVVPEGSSFTAIAAGGAHALALSAPASLTLTSLNNAETLRTGTMETITWESEGSVAKVWIEYSTDNGVDWSPVAPSNEGNTGSYEWLVPVATSQECLVRIRPSLTIQGADQSDAPLTIYRCPLSGDVTGDCVVDLADIAVIESQWLYSYDPFAEPFSKVDFDGDGSVNAADLMIMGSYWLRSDCGAFGCQGTNVDGIGSVDMYDLAEVGEYWGTN